MLINFRRLYEAIFKSFDVSADTDIVTQLESDKVEKVMIIKRSWIFGLFLSGKFIAMLFIMIANIYLIYLNFEKDETIMGILMGILIFNMSYWIFSVLMYFRRFKKIYGERSTIHNTSILKEELKEGDLVFTKFFNQTIFNYFVLIGITIFIAYEIIFVVSFSSTGLYGGLNIILLFLQIFLSAKFKKRMIDLEMDFAIIIPGKIIFYNQSNLKRNVLTINAEKIKTITSSHSKIIGSMFNFGDIVVLTEGDSADIGEMRLQFISSPSETVYEINELLGKNTSKE